MFQAGKSPLEHDLSFNVVRRIDGDHVFIVPSEYELWRGQPDRDKLIGFKCRALRVGFSTIDATRNGKLLIGIKCRAVITVWFHTTKPQALAVLHRNRPYRIGVAL